MVRLFFTSISLLITSSAFSQQGFTFLRDLQVDPMDRKFQELKIKSITQYNIRESDLYTPDSVSCVEYLDVDYKLDFDSTAQLVTMKFDFKDYFHTLMINGVSIRVNGMLEKGLKDTMGVLLLNHKELTKAFSYSTYVFNYANDQLVRIDYEPSKPMHPIAGVLDGVYIKADLHSSSCVDTYFDTLKNMRYKLVSSDGRLRSATEYKYQKETLVDTASFELNGRTIKLNPDRYVIKEIFKNNNGRFESTFLVYEFFN